MRPIMYDDYPKWVDLSLGGLFFSIIGLYLYSQDKIQIISESRIQIGNLLITSSVALLGFSLTAVSVLAFLFNDEDFAILRNSRYNDLLFSAFFRLIKMLLGQLIVGIIYLSISSKVYLLLLLSTTMITLFMLFRAIIYLEMIIKSRIKKVKKKSN